MITLFKDSKGTGNFMWRERLFPLQQIFFVRYCPKSFKVEINYKEKVKEDIHCTEAEVENIKEQLKAKCDSD